MKKKMKIAGLIVLIIFIVLFAGMSYFVGMQVFAESTQLVTNEETTGVSESFFKEYGINYEEYQKHYEIEKIEISSTFEQHVIPADYIYTQQVSDSKNNKTVVLVHGLGGNRYSNYPLAEFFLEQGYNVLTCDQRSSNENMAKYTTFGYWEKYDLIDCINYVREYAPEQTVGIWSSSFGGATTGLALGENGTDKLVDFAVFDCPVSSMEWMLKEQMKGMGPPMLVSYMAACGNFVNQSKLGFSYEEADVSKAMKDVKTLVLIINSKKDVVTPYFMGKDIYETIQSNDKEIWTVEDSEHAEIWQDYKEEYKNKIIHLLEVVEK